MADEVRCESCGDILLEGGRVCTTCLSAAKSNMKRGAIANLELAEMFIKKALVKLTLAGVEDTPEDEEK
jgi:hypothetical protein